MLDMEVTTYDFAILRANSRDRSSQNKGGPQKRNWDRCLLIDISILKGLATADGTLTHHLP